MLLNITLFQQQLQDLTSFSNLKPNINLFNLLQQIQSICVCFTCQNFYWFQLISRKVFKLQGSQKLYCLAIFQVSLFTFLTGKIIKYFIFQQIMQQFVLQGYDLNDVTLIGQGSYAKVFKVKSIKMNDYVAIKQMQMKKIRQQNQLNSLIQQIELMKQLKNSHLVGLYETSIEKNYCHIVIQLCQTDLRKMIMSKKGKVGQQIALTILQNIIECLKVFIQKSYIHRDIKPENILAKNGVYKLTDLGFIVRADINCVSKLQQFCGTPIYMAPQLLFKQPYTAKCDIWSLGMVFYELIYGSTPWPAKYVQSYKQNLKKRPLSFPFDVKVGKQVKDFLKRTLVVDQQKRMSWKQLFEHPLVKNKHVGELVIPKFINQQAKRILFQLQRQTKRKFINIIEIFSQFQQISAFDFEQFGNLLKKLNPTITSYQIRIIYQACDKNHDNFIQVQQFRQVFCHHDYSDTNNHEKQIDQIIAIICSKHIQAQNLFQKFDTNKSGTICFDQFREMIKSIAPYYNEELLYLAFKKIDSNNDGIISRSQFCKCIGVRFVSNKNYVGIWVQKASKNIRDLKNYLKLHKISSVNILKLADNNDDLLIDMKQFKRFVELIQFPLSMQEIIDVFKILDTNRSNKISLGQLEDCIQM